MASASGSPQDAEIAQVAGGDPRAVALVNSNSNDNSGSQQPSARTERFYHHAVLSIAVGFFGVFGGFQAAQGLQTSVNKTLGFINLAVLYATFAIVCVIAPTVLAKLEVVVGLRTVMFVCSIAYIAMIVSNVDTSNWALPISMNALVGLAAPLLWTCQNDFVGRCACHCAMSKVGEGTDRDQCELEAEQSKMTATFNGSFFSIYQFSGMSGTLLSSVLMLGLKDQAWMKTALFLLLAAISFLGALAFLMLPRVESSNASDSIVSIKATAALVGDLRLALLIPLMFTNGMTLAFLLGDYPKDVVCPVLGSQFTGFTIATFFLVNSIASAAWGKLVASKRILRRTAFLMALLFELVFFIGKMLWKNPKNYYDDKNDKWVPEPGQSVQVTDALLVFAFAAVFAMGDAFWEQGPVAVLQNFFLGTDSIVPAMAHYKLWQSLGFAVQFTIGAEFGSYPVMRAGLLAGLSVASVLCIFILDRCKASVQ